MKIGIDIGRERLYNKAFENKNRKDIIMWEVLRIENGQSYKISFIEKNSNFRQGIWLATDVGIMINESMFPQITVWEDNAPKEFIIKCFSDVGLLSIYNVWDRGRGRESQAYTSGMQLEEQNNKKIYHCNDYGFETDFNKLVFSIENIKSK